MADSWFRCHTNLGDKKVSRMLAKDLNISLVAAVGHLCLLWGWLSEHIDLVPRGNIGHLDDDQIESAGRWHGKPGKFAKWIRQKHTGQERPNTINGWDEYNGKLEQIRASGRQRVADFRRRQQAMENELSNRDVTPDVTVTETVTDTVTSRLPNANGSQPDVDVDVVVGTESKDHRGSTPRARAKKRDKRSATAIHDRLSQIDYSEP